MAYNKQRAQDIWRREMEQRLGWLGNKEYIEIMSKIEELLAMSYIDGKDSALQDIKTIRNDTLNEVLKLVEEDITRNQERGFPTSAVAKQWILTQLKHHD